MVCPVKGLQAIKVYGFLGATVLQPNGSLWSDFRGAVKWRLLSMSHHKNTSALRALLEQFYIHIYIYIPTRRQCCFPMLHDNLLSHHINLSFPLRWQRLSLPPSSRSPNTTLWGQATQNNNSIPRHSSLLWSTTAHHCLQEIFSATYCGHMETWAVGLLFPSGWFPGAPAHHEQCVISCTNSQRWQYKGHPTGPLLPKAACSYAG